MTSKGKLIGGTVLALYLVAVFATKDYSPDPAGEATEGVSIGSLMDSVGSDRATVERSSRPDAEIPTFDEDAIRASMAEVFEENMIATEPAAAEVPVTNNPSDEAGTDMGPPLSREEATAIYQAAMRNGTIVSYDQPTETITANAASWNALPMPQKVNLVKAATALITSVNPNASYKIISNGPGNRTLVDFSPSSGVMFYEGP